MNTLVNNTIIANYKNGHIIIQMESGVEVKFPISKNKRLAHGNSRELNNVELSSYCLHWPDLDEDLSFKELLAGDYGQCVKSQTSHCN